MLRHRRRCHRFGRGGQTAASTSNCWYRGASGPSHRPRSAPKGPEPPARTPTPGHARPP